MPLPETNDTRKQVQQNTDSLRILEDRNNPVFKRIRRDARLPSVSIGPKIYQVVSWADPYVTSSGDFLDRAGVYNCVEMQFVTDSATFGFSTGLTGIESPASGGFKSRIKDIPGGQTPGFIPSRDRTASNQYYQEWDGATSYITGSVVSSTYEYERDVDAKLRKVVDIYKATQPSTGIPVANDAFWQKQTVEVFNLAEQYGMSGEWESKLARFDIIHGNEHGGDGGQTVIAGTDADNQAKMFYLDQDATTSFTAICNVVYKHFFGDNGQAFRFAAEGELGFNIPLSQLDRNLTSNLFEWSLVSESVSPRLLGMWTSGHWTEVNIPIGVNINEGVKFDVNSEIAVKVDGTTIGFNGSGELEQI